MSRDRLSELRQPQPRLPQICPVPFLTCDLLKLVRKLATGFWKRCPLMIREKHPAENVLLRFPSYSDAVVSECDTWSCGSRFEIKPENKEPKVVGQVKQNDGKGGLVNF